MIKTYFFVIEKFYEIENYSGGSKNCLSVEKKRSWVQEGVPGKKNMFTTFKEKVHLI
jgi:hypothetical protein